MLLRKCCIHMVCIKRNKHGSRRNTCWLPLSHTSISKCFEPHTTPPHQGADSHCLLAPAAVQLGMGSHTHLLPFKRWGQSRRTRTPSADQLLLQAHNHHWLVTCGYCCHVVLHVYCCYCMHTLYAILLPCLPFAFLWGAFFSAVMSMCYLCNSAGGLRHQLGLA